MSPPGRNATPADAAARLAKAAAFAEAAALLYDEVSGTAEYPDVYVTNAVHAGIAAADVICIRRIGLYSATGAHEEAVRLLGTTDVAAAKNLSRLLGVKTKAGYSTSPVSAADVSMARRSHLALLEAARAAH